MTFSNQLNTTSSIRGRPKSSRCRCPARPSLCPAAAARSRHAPAAVVRSRPSALPPPHAGVVAQLPSCPAARRRPAWPGAAAAWPTLPACRGFAAAAMSSWVSGRRPAVAGSRGGRERAKKRLVFRSLGHGGTAAYAPLGDGDDDGQHTKRGPDLLRAVSYLAMAAPPAGKDERRGGGKGAGRGG